MKKIITLLIAVIITCVAYSQVQVQKADAANINTIMPFYNTTLASNVVTKTFTFTPPPVTPLPNPPAGIYDSAYDETDDTTYDYKPILDFGSIINSNITIADGNWQSTSSGNVWGLKIVIDSAFNTSLHFNNFSLSPTSTCYITDGQNQVIKGPYTKESMTGIPSFGTFPMDGNSCFIFIVEPNDANLALSGFTISELVAGYQPIGEIEVPPITPDSTVVENGTATRCIPSVRCYNDWMTSARAVSRWYNGQTSTCSGTLLNNEKFDGTSYYYSAQHCLPGNVGNLAFSSFQFQLWQTGCNTGVIANYIEFYGSTLLHTVGYNSGDAILLRLNSGPGVGDAPTYSGWSRQNGNPNASSSGIIHHPRGDDMRFTQPKQIRTFLWDWDFWKASYSHGTGLVLPGSSGSGLLNEWHQVIGCLSRGFPQTCSFILSGDRWGKFHKGWGGMRQYLSPLNDDFSMGGMTLSPLTISGNAVINCNSTQEYSVPNLVGCTFFWTVSSTLSIVSGQGTNKIMVSHNGTPPPNTFEVISLNINDSKGSFPNGRNANTSLNVRIGPAGEITGTITQGTTVTPLRTGGNLIRSKPPAVTHFTAPNCTGTSVALLAGTPNWNFTGGTTGTLSVQLYPGEAATFMLYANASNCGQSSKIVAYVAAMNSFTYELSPNPATNFVTVKAIKDETDTENSSRKLSDLEYTVKFIDVMTGSLVLQTKVNKGEIQKNINVSNLRKGHYAVQIVEGNDISTLRLLLE